MLKQKYFLADIFILSAEKQPIKLSWRKIEWLLIFAFAMRCMIICTHKLYSIPNLLRLNGFEVEVSLVCQHRFYQKDGEDFGNPLFLGGKVKASVLPW